MALETAICIIVLLGILQFCNLTSLIVLYINALWPSCLLGGRGPHLVSVTLFTPVALLILSSGGPSVLLSAVGLCLPLTY